LTVKLGMIERSRSDSGCCRAAGLVAIVVTFLRVGRHQFGCPEQGTVDDVILLTDLTAGHRVT
jgi:hypothetical protein